MTRLKINFTARQKRAIRLLRSGPVMRKDIDRLAGCLNGPDLIFQLRQMFAALAAGNVANGVTLTNADRARLMVAANCINRLVEAFA